MRSGRSRGGFFEEEPIFPRQPPPSFPTFRITRRLVLLLGLAAAILFFLLLLQPLVGIYTDWLWFDRLGYGGVFRTRLQTQVISFAVFALIFFMFGAANALPVLGFRTRRRILTYMGIRQRVLRTPMAAGTLAGVAVIALLFGRIGASQWQTTLRFFNQASFGRTDPVWHRDLSFYLFSLPFLRFIWGWLLGMLIVVTGGVLVLYLSRTNFQTLTLSRIALGHLSILGALFFLLLAFHFWLDLAEIVLGKRSFVWGAGFTDLTARVPGYWVMVVLMLATAALLLYNLFLREQWPLAAAGAAWIGGVILVTVLVPAAVQRFVVAPSELARERPYIERDIASTREAYGLDKMQEVPFTVDQQVTPQLVAQHRQTIDSARLWDPRYLPATYTQIQGLKQFYEFNNVAVDRYVLSGQVRQLELSARELNPQKGIQANWVNLRLKFTHGYGAVASPVNVAQEGLPQLILRDFPPTGDLPVDRPAIYFGRNVSDYVIVDSREREFDYPAGDQNIFNRWEGHSGVALTGPIRRLAFAMRMGDVNILVSDRITSESQILFRRQVAERVAAIAPFLAIDSDPYLVIADGRFYWILDAYTRSNAYPYSARTETVGGTSGFNYIRNSVKVVVDAYEGTTTLYRIDPSDPIAATYSKIFPGLLKPIESMPASLRPHLRYPQDLFKIQAAVFTLYHMRDPQVFYSKEDQWGIAYEHITLNTRAPIDPYYVIMRLPDQPKEEFLLMLPFTPTNKQNMIAYMAARSDEENYGKLITFRYSKDQLIFGPEQIESSVRVDSVIQPQLALLSQAGSNVILGNLLVLPVGRALLFVEPVYTKSEATNFPQLKKVIVADGTRVVMRDTLESALEVLVGGSTRPGPVTPGQPTGTPPTATSLIQEANRHYTQAQTLLRQGDLAGYQAEMNEVGRILQQLQGLVSPSASPSPSPTRR
jgi:uncharacterized membrane protein (UPF0182 family)